MLAKKTFERPRTFGATHSLRNRRVKVEGPLQEDVCAFVLRSVGKNPSDLRVS